MLFKQGGVINTCNIVTTGSKIIQYIRRVNVVHVQNRRIQLVVESTILDSMTDVKAKIEILQNLEYRTKNTRATRAADREEKRAVGVLYNGGYCG